MADKVYVSPHTLSFCKFRCVICKVLATKQKINESKCKFYLNRLFNLFIYISIFLRFNTNPFIFHPE